MISQADDNCKQLVAGNYDVIINESTPETLKTTLTDYLELFQRHEQELGQANCSYVNEFRLLKELSRTLKEDKANLQVGEMDFNQRKNRYKDIIPFGHTRVILKSENRGHLRQQAALINSNEIQLESKQLIDGDETDSDRYINANYIRGPGGFPRAYIACQGPLACTLIDFWRMIWECNVSVVIMACNEFESGKPKCELYWSDSLGESQIYGNIQVTLMRVRQINPDFLIRKFSVKLLEPEIRREKQGTNNSQIDSNNNHDTRFQPTTNLQNNNLQRLANNGSPMSTNSSSSNSTQHQNQDQNQHGLISSMTEGLIGGATSSESVSATSDTTSATSTSVTATKRPVRPPTRTVLAERTICQFHYTTWPDHGVPASVGSILELVHLVRQVQPAEEKPIVVHCSAGCGRTGTICCIDYVWGLLRMAKLDRDFNLCRIIMEMRKQRMAMVQTLEQYILCHRAVAALFMQQLQLIDGRVLLDTRPSIVSVRDGYFEDRDNIIDREGLPEDEKKRLEEADDQLEPYDNDDLNSFDSEYDLGPVFI